LNWEDFFAGSLLGGVIGVVDCVLYNMAFAGAPVLLFWLIVLLSIAIGVALCLLYPEVGIGVLFGLLITTATTSMFNLLGGSFAMNLIVLMIFGVMFIVASLVVK